LSVAYTTINGEIVSEKRNGVPSDYIPDALGSTIALLSDTHQITDTWTYWPNGQVRTHTGSSITPFTFGGRLGYHSDLVGNFTYVCARQLRTGLARWQTLDQVWPLAKAYTYAYGTSVSRSDRTGLDPCNTTCSKSNKKCISTYCRWCRVNGGDDRCMATCNSMVLEYHADCNDLAPPPPPPPLLPSCPNTNLPPICQSMINGLGSRMLGGTNGNANTAWAGNCALCCVALGMPAQGDDFVGDCLAGDFPGFDLNTELGLDCFLQFLVKLQVNTFFRGIELRSTREINV